MMRLSLDSKFLLMIKNILKKNIPEYQVIAFGSRVTGTYKPHSDLDLCIVTHTPLTLLQLASLKEAFTESDLPFRIDIVDWSTLSLGFKQIILNCFEEIQA